MTYTGDKIKEYRKAKKLTQDQLADLTGISKMLISQYERGVRNPKHETLAKIAKGLNVFIYQLAPEEIVTFHSGEEFEIERNKILSNMRIKMLNDRFNLLNVKGQDKAIEQVEMLTKIEEYKK